MKRAIILGMAITCIVTSTAFGSINRDGIYNILVKANNKTEDFYQRDKISIISTATAYPSTERIIRNSASNDCRTIKAIYSNQYGINYYNFFHDPKKIELYTYDSQSKKYKKNPAKDAKKTLSNTLFNKYIEVSDECLKLISKYSQITQNQDTIKITTTFPKSIEKEIIRDKVKTTPEIGKNKILKIKYSITLKNNKIVKVRINQVINPQSKKLTTQTDTTISYEKQNIKPFKPGNKK